MKRYSINAAGLQHKVIFHGGDGSPAVTIRPDGTVEILKPLPEASQAFWEAVKDLGVTIAADLAAAQQEIARLRAALEKSEKRRIDLDDTIHAVFNAVGYSTEYTMKWPKEKVSVTFKRWFDEQVSKK